MKATVCTKTHELGVALDRFRISKPKAADVPICEADMQACFHKLKELVPTIPQDRKISRVALLQHVIDYILDLELTLDTHPTSRNAPPSLLQTALAAMPASIDRKPLGEATNICYPEVNISVFKINDKFLMVQTKSILYIT